MLYGGLLPELWLLIFELCDNKSLINLKQVSKSSRYGFDKKYYSIDYLIQNRRLMYPRINGKSKTHIVDFPNDDLKWQIDKVLKFLCITGVDLVKGDVVKSKDSYRYQGIYDGQKLISFFCSM